MIFGFWIDLDDLYSRALNHSGLQRIILLLNRVHSIPYARALIDAFITAPESVWGLQLGRNSAQEIFLKSISENSPAHKHLLPHDILISLNSVSLANRNIDDQTNLCRK